MRSGRQRGVTYFLHLVRPVTLPCRGGRWRQSEDVGSSSSSSIGLGADVGVACGGLLFVVVTVQLVLHQEDEDEDEDRGHDDATDDDDHGASEELEEKIGNTFSLVSRVGPLLQVRVSITQTESFKAG